MRLLRHALWLLAVLVSPSLSAAADERPEETLASLKKREGAAFEELESRRKPGTTEAEQKKALYRYYETVADLGRRAMAVVKRRPDAPDAVEALIWARSVGTEGNAELAGVVYDFVVEHYLDSDAILPLCRLAWVNAVKSPQVETCLRAAVERSKNPKVRALCCFSLGRCYQELASAARRSQRPRPSRDPRRNSRPLRASRDPTTPLPRSKEAHARGRGVFRSHDQGVRRSTTHGHVLPAAGKAGRGNAFPAASPRHRSHRA